MEKSRLFLWILIIFGWTGLMILVLSLNFYNEILKMIAIIILFATMVFGFIGMIFYTHNEFNPQGSIY